LKFILVIKIVLTVNHKLLFMCVNYVSKSVFTITSLYKVEIN